MSLSISGASTTIGRSMGFAGSTIRSARNTFAPTLLPAQSQTIYSSPNIRQSSIQSPPPSPIPSPTARPSASPSFSARPSASPSAQSISPSKAKASAIPTAGLLNALPDADYDLNSLLIFDANKPA